MKAYITTCCKEKSKILGDIPMMDRYISERIGRIYKNSIEDNVAFFVLSGKFGLLSPSNKIPWYDLILEEDQVLDISTKVRHKLLIHGITEVALFVNKEWVNYINTIKNACLEAGIKFSISYTKETI